MTTTEDQIKQMTVFDNLHKIEADNIIRNLIY